jgi:hypothetical protein
LLLQRVAHFCASAKVGLFPIKVPGAASLPLVQGCGFFSSLNFPQSQKPHFWLPPKMGRPLHFIV